ncbi:hypothetical protein [Streptomyces sp. NPDC020917]|uniref:hypothetical protein n=1 Tax=Streptomyces sp. NPDC020917 TaxID=3365102 RepID=UPI003787405D
MTASLLELLTHRLDDRPRAAAVSAGDLDADRFLAARELDAFTWSWRITQLGVSILCAVLTLAVAMLIPPSKRTATGRT